MKFEEKLIALRKSNNWSQEDLADKIGTTRQAVSRWETGVALPDVKNLKKICDIFSVSADFLINDGLEKTSTENNQQLRYEVNTEAYLYLIAGVICLSSAVFGLINGIMKHNIYSFVAMGLSVTLTIIMFDLYRKKK